MEQIGNELKKVLKAGIGAMATGVEKTQEAIESLSRKGEPLYEQAKTAVVDTADKIKKAVNDSGIADAFSCRPKVETLISDCQQLTLEELDQLRDALEDIRAHKTESAPEEPADDQVDDDPDDPDGKV